MPRSTPAPVFVLTVMLASMAVAAEFTPTVKTPEPNASSGSRVPPPRTVSPLVASMLADQTPNLVPAARPAVTAASEASEAEKPRNGIIRLPRYVVQETKPPSFKERDLLTPKGRLDLALKKYPGLQLGSFGMLKNDAWAAALSDEDAAIERQKEMYDLMSLLPGPHGPPIFMGRPSFGLPMSYGGPWGGLVVPWERR